MFIYRAASHLLRIIQVACNAQPLVQFGTSTPARPMFTPVDAVAAPFADAAANRPHTSLTGSVPIIGANISMGLNIARDNTPTIDYRPRTPAARLIAPIARLYSTITAHFERAVTRLDSAIPDAATDPAAATRAARTSLWSFAPDISGLHWLRGLTPQSSSWSIQRIRASSRRDGPSIPTKETNYAARPEQLAFSPHLA